jgi:UDP-N-acetylglucosamine 2-epimerase
LTPSIQLRDYTDRQEAIPIFSWLVGRDPEQIEKLTGEALAMADTWKQSIKGKPNPFGSGTAGQRIARCVKEWLDG